MLIPGLTITGGALAYVGWRSRKQKTIIELLRTQTPAPAVMEEKSQRVSALYKGLQKQLSETTERAKYILNPDSLLPVSHSTRATLVSQLASPWNDLAVSEIDQKTHSKEKGPLAVEEWQTYGRYLYRYWRPYWRWGLLSVGLGMSFGLYRIVYATALKVLLDGVALSKGGTALAILLKLLIALPITFALMVASELLSARLSSRIVNDVRYDMFEHAQSLSLDYYKRTQRGDLLSRFSADMAILEKAMGASFINSVYITFTLPLYMVALFMLSWQLTLFILFVIPTSTYLLRRHSPNLNEANRTLRQREGAVLSVVQEGISAQPLIQSFGIRQFIQDAYWHELRKLEQTNIDTKFKMRLVRNFSLFSVYFLDVGSMGLGILLVLAGTIPVSTLVAFQVLMSILRREVHYMIELFNELLQAVAAAGRVDQLFQVPIAVRDAVGALELPAFKQAIRFEQVSFSYTDHAYQLQDINLTIEAGQFVAFVGPSGAGKSTIFNLLMRFYDVSGGRVTYDGYDVRDVSQLSLRSQMGVVLQDTFIFNTTILNNIRVIRPEATEADVVAAAKAAELHDFIMSLPDGYQSHAGEAGGQLSGGQKQRIAIARAMLCDPDILLLDEATSSLDADTAAAVNATILDLARSRTVISITHNLSSVVDADKIYVLNQGSLVEQGTHAQLLDQDGLYAQLWQTQSNS